jgi:lipopolysaccharide/colanic/teichoic acid biosynthesis glycosyltransferase
MRYARLKRGLDVAGALVALVASLPLVLLAALAVRATMGAPILFRQRRTGLHGREFLLLKLRTMRAAGVETGADGDGARLTALGRWLRASSVDELPQLWNVLRGDMSLVGPRPLLPAYLSRYSPTQARRHEVSPGITGLTQVSGRNALGWEVKFQLDVWYVDHRSLRLDLWILWRTLFVVLAPAGVRAAGHATMPEFLGPEARTR